MSGDLSICEVFLSKVCGQTVKIMHQRGNAQNQPKAGLEVKVKKSASHHIGLIYQTNDTSTSQINKSPEVLWKLC